MLDALWDIPDLGRVGQSHGLGSAVLESCLQLGGKGHWVEGAQEENKVQRENKRGCAVLSLLNPQSPGSPRGEGAGL